MTEQIRADPERVLDVVIAQRDRALTELAICQAAYRQLAEQTQQDAGGDG